jgi:hypothetical protein
MSDPLDDGGGAHAAGDAQRGKAGGLVLRSSSSSSVPMMMAPVAPSGWPMAMEPPLTLTSAGSTSKAC